MRAPQKPLEPARPQKDIDPVGNEPVGLANPGERSMKRKEQPACRFGGLHAPLEQREAAEHGRVGQKIRRPRFAPGRERTRARDELALVEPPARPILEAVAACAAGIGPDGLSVCVGPEGDFTPAELAALMEIATPVNFGPTILRAETAAIFAVSVLSSWMASDNARKGGVE